MPEQTRMDNRTLVRRTLITVGAMVGSCVLVVGTLTLVASVIVGRAVEPRDVPDAGSVTTQAPTNALHPSPASPHPTASSTATQGK